MNEENTGESRNVFSSLIQTVRRILLRSLGKENQKRPLTDITCLQTISMGGFLFRLVISITGGFTP